MTKKSFYAGDAIAATFKDLRAHVSTIYFTSALLCLPVLFATFIQRIGDPVFGFLLSLFASSVVTVWLTAALVRGTWAFATGEDPGVGGLLDRATNWRLFSLAGTYLLIWLIVVVLFIVSFLPGAIVTLLVAGGTRNFVELIESAAPAAIIGIVFGVIVFLVFLVIVFFRFALAAQPNVLEETGPAQSLKRSRKLMKGHWLDFFLLILVVWLVTIVIGLLTRGPGLIIEFTTVGSARAEFGPMFLASGPAEAPPLPPVAAAVVAISTYLTQLVVTPIAVISTTNFYLSLKGEEASEAWKAPEWLAGAAGQFSHSSPPLTEVVPAEPDEEKDSGKYESTSWIDQSTGDLGEQDRSDDR